MDITPYILPNQDRVLGTCGNDFKDYLISHRRPSGGDRGIYFSYPMNSGDDGTRHCWGILRIRGGYLTLDYDGMKQTTAHTYRDPNFPDGAKWCPSDVQYDTPYRYGGRQVANMYSTCVLDPWQNYDPEVRVYDAGYQDICGFSIHRIKIHAVGAQVEDFWFARDVGLVGYAGPTWSGGWVYCKGNDGTLVTCGANW